jgi:hypothetical protein
MTSGNIDKERLYHLIHRDYIHCLPPFIWNTEPFAPRQWVIFSSLVNADSANDEIDQRFYRGGRSMSRCCLVPHSNFKKAQRRLRLALYVCQQVRGSLFITVYVAVKVSPWLVSDTSTNHLQVLNGG